MAQMKYFYELTISSSPHAHSPVTTQTIMRDVLIALVPALLGSIYFFGFRALLVTLVSAAACVFFEWGFCKVRKLHCKTYDLSAVVTGVLLAFVCPVTIPYWTIILGDFFAIVLVKMLFGGLGKNIVNPALAGRAFLFSWPVLMSNWVKVGFSNAAGLLSTADAVTAATPMSAMHQGALPEESILDMFLGNIGGSLGEVSALCLLLCLLLLLLLYRSVTPHSKPALPVLPGAVVGGLSILAISILFSTMISASARYTLVYGSLASLIILMLWLHLMGTIILIGGLVNLLYWQLHNEKKK